MIANSHKYWWCSALLAISIILLLVGGSFTALLNFSQAELDFSSVLADSYTQHVITFSFYQAALSTGLSIGLAIPLARAFSRREFVGKQLIIKLFNLSLVLPIIIAIFGIVAVHGKNGWVNQILALFHIETGHYIYGLTGILLAHLFFNVPLATRILLQTLDSIPSESWRLASQLNMQSRHIFITLEWPKIKQQLPSLISLIFMLCFTSFAIVMSLGGGPDYATLEVAIYQALKFEFDIEQAVALAIIQVAITVALMLFSAIFLKSQPMSAPSGNYFRRPDCHSLSSKLSDGLSFIVASCLLAPPMLAILSSGINSNTLSVLSQPMLWQATGISLQIALSSGLLSLLLACAILFSTRILKVRFKLMTLAYGIENIGAIILVVPALVLGTGLFLLLRPYVDVFSIAAWLVILVNALMALPYLLRVLNQPIQDSFASYDKLAISLGLSRLQRLRIIEWPLLRKPIAMGLGLACVLSLGDLSVIALFGSQDMQTLPLVLYRQLGSYQLDAAAVTAIFLLTLCGVIFYLFERIIGGKNA
ncbi:thiamine/thiamine pyrophosphate ABC transporter permease [Moritella sp. Urea-trap-13]|uniref:thiamine/thiamine pyrophosphate ABC transporter permease n=1 Tax=Moritella sp. Urea-trap-13 TaxID=2058327 RepID=UPI000C321DD7|nr:thiamine/thiamine pyrophosphate ABC transporter permease [Moritella sp. Urea-trap-13]PKH07344.1 thiamine/thiamine pyrophosphate ABC transporter, permease protein [Moritella sp. Urea-trap-13]